MSEWTVTIETPLGAAADDETLEAIHETLIGDPATTAPVVGFLVPLPIITARLLVTAESADEATDIARSAFERALTAAGVTAEGQVSRVDPA
jgi:hypothetical protein